MSDRPAPESTHDHDDAGRECAAAEHHHKGKSSESLLDKTAILAALEITPGQTILDAGCGDGYMSRAFAAAMDNKGVVYALDPDEEAIAQLQRDTKYSNIQALVGDITTRTPLPDASIDLVYLATVVHGFSPSQMAGFQNELIRILKPRARLAIVEIDKQDTPFGPPMELRFSPAELQQRIPLIPTALERAGEHFYLQVFEKPA